MFATAPSAPISIPAERLAGILDTLCRAIADRGGRKLLAGPLVILIWTRLRRISARVLTLAARIEAGTNKPARPRRPRAARPRRPPPPLSLPRGKAWLVRLARMEAAAAGSQLRHLLAQPDMQALAAADPRMGRLLRPLCHMLGVTPTPEIAQPAPRPRPAPAATEASPPPPAPMPPARPEATISPAPAPRRRAFREARRAASPPGPSRAPPVTAGPSAT
ncbi:MAG: hypothetical protein M0Z28_04355 [Rhodospirillales bacterium]|nr:hypothetical protein [Rhodospirillales bacterium]